MNALIPPNALRLVTILIGGFLASSTTAQDLLPVSAEIGITPESIVLAQLDSTAATTMLSRIEGAQELQDALAHQHSVADEAAGFVSLIATMLRSDSLNDALLEQYEQNVAELEAARVKIAALREALFNEAVQGFAAAPIEKLQIWQAGTSYRVPEEVRTRLRTEDEWKAIQKALCAERRALRIEEDLEEVHADILDDVRGEIEVIEGKLLLETNLEVIQETFALFQD